MEDFASFAAAAGAQRLPVGVLGAAARAKAAAERSYFAVRPLRGGSRSDPPGRGSLGSPTPRVSDWHVLSELDNFPS